MSDLLEQGITALQDGDKIKARRLFGRAIQAHPQNEQAWLCLSGAVDSDKERLTCLNKVLAINPGNQEARRGVAAIRQKQADQPAEAVAAFPWISRPLAEQSHLSQPASPTLDHSRGLDELFPEQRKALESFVNLIAQEIATGRSRREIVERLTHRGFPRKAVEQLVNKVARAKKRAQVTRYGKTYGKAALVRAATTVVVAVTSIATYNFAREFEGPLSVILLFGTAVGTVTALAAWLMVKLWDRIH